MSFEKFEIEEIEIDEKDLGIADVTSSFNPEKNPVSPKNIEEEIEVEIEGEKKELKEEKKEEELSLEVEEKEVKKPLKKEKKEEVSEIKKDIEETEFFKQATEFLISEGIFEDFAEKDQIEYNEDTFKNLLKEQAVSKAKEEYEKLTEGLSDQEKELIDFFKGGGNLSQLATYQKDIEDYNEADTDDEDTAEQLIRINYTNKGKSEKWVKSFIESLKDRGSLKEEAEESKVELVKEAEEEKERYKNSVKQAQEEYQFKIEKTNSDLTKYVNSDSSLTSAEQKKLLNFLKLDKKLKNGNIVNELQIKLYEVQNNPQQYIELGKFLQDIDGYKNKVQKEADKKATLKSFNILRGKSSMNQSSATLPSASSGVKSKSPFEF